MDRASHRKKIGDQRAFGANLKVKVKLEKKNVGLNFQDLILRLSQFWARQDCVLQQPYDVEVGAGTMHPETFLRVLGPEPYRGVYVTPSCRAAAGSSGETPNLCVNHHKL